MQRLLEKIRRRLAGSFRLAAAGISIAGLLVSMTAMFAFHPVTIVREDGTTQILLTTATTAEDVMIAAGITPGLNDEVIFHPANGGGGVLYINRSFTVGLRIDGETKYYSFVDGTVQDVLRADNVQLGEHDKVMPGENTLLQRGMMVEVRRVTFREDARRVEVLGEDVESYLATLTEEERAAFVYSKSRIYDVLFLDTLEDGVVTVSEVLSLTAVYHPYDPPLTEFTPGVACSTIDGFVGIELDENGIPTTYSEKITGANCTAYSAPAGGLGAGGQGLYCGTVAVNPNRIPYGTRLYITAADGSFVYGYAIASDTGIAMMDGRADFDLFFETYDESCWFGRRWLDVYVLD